MPNADGPDLSRLLNDLQKLVGEIKESVETSIRFRRVTSRIQSVDGGLWIAYDVPVHWYVKYDRETPHEGRHAYDVNAIFKEYSSMKRASFEKFRARWGNHGISYADHILLAEYALDECFTAAEAARLIDYLSRFPIISDTVESYIRLPIEQDFGGYRMLGTNHADGVLNLSEEADYPFDIVICGYYDCSEGTLRYKEEGCDGASKEDPEMDWDGLSQDASDEDLPF